jgi:hypothetical protein
MLNFNDNFLLKIAIFLLWFGAVFDPVGQFFYIRYVAICFAIVSLLALIIFGDINYSEKSLRYIFIMFVGIVMPIYGLLIYSFNRGDAGFIDTSYIASAFLIITSLLYRGRSACVFGIRSFLLSSRLLALTIITVFASQVASSFDWYWFFVERQVAFISQRDYAGLSFPYVYFVSSPLLIFLLSYEFNRVVLRRGRSRYICFVTATIALFLSGTRFNMLVSVAFVPIYLLISGSFRRFFLLFLALVPILLFSIIFFELLPIFVSIFSSSEESNSVKLSYIDGYLKIFEDPLRLIFGQGFNAHEWSSDFRAMLPLELGASKTELTYLEFFRVYGIFLGLIFLLLIFGVLIESKKLLGNLGWIYPGLLLFLLSASLNPYIFSTNGMLPLGLILSIVFYFGRTSNTNLISTSGYVKNNL